MGAGITGTAGESLMTSPEKSLEAAVMVDRLNEVRERWLGCVALSAEALSTLEEMDELFDRANAAGLKLGEVDEPEGI